ncbi:hypothetical protein Tco_0351428, partial [Tanacetum coccineum]
VADEHRDFALRVNRLIGEINEACSDRGAFVRELRSVTGETVPAMTVVFLEKMMDKEGNREWQLRELEKEAREIAFGIESFIFKLMDAEPSHRRVFDGDDRQRREIAEDVRLRREINMLCAHVIAIVDKRESFVC